MKHIHRLLVLSAALLAAPSVSRAAAESDAPQERAPLQAADAAGLASAVATLRAEAVKGLPEGWDDAAAVAEDPFLKSLIGAEGDGKFRGELIVKDGEFQGVGISFGGHAYLYKPPQLFAVGLPEDGQPSDRALVLRDGKVYERSQSSTQPKETEAAAGSAARTVGKAEKEPGVAFDGGAGRGAPSSRPWTEVRTISSRGKAPFKAVFTPDGAPLAIANAYKDAAPAKVEKGQLYWDGKTLMAAETAAEGAEVRGRAVGYMADMQGAKDGDILFWHGGAVPDARGRHPAARRNWALYYIPKVEGGVEVEGGNTTARPVSKYALMDLRRARTVNTEDGVRTDLSTALEERSVVRRLPPQDPAARGKEDVPETRALLTFRAPGKGRDGAQRCYVDMSGNAYQEREQGGTRYVVWTNRLFSVKEPPVRTQPERTQPVAAAPVQQREPAPAARVYGPLPPPPALPAKETPLAAALKSPGNAAGREETVARLTTEFLGKDQNTLEAEKERNELEVLLQEPNALTRVQAAKALLGLDPKRPNEAAVSALRWFLLPASRTEPPAMRAYALSALMSMEKPTTGLLGELMRSVEDRREATEVREQAYMTLLKLQPDDKSRLSIMRLYQEDPTTSMLVPRMGSFVLDGLRAKLEAYSGRMTR